MRQRILLITKNYPPQIGGIEKYAFDLYNKLVQDWNEVKIIAAWPRREKLLAQKTILSRFIYLISEFFRLSEFLFRCFTEGFWWLRKKTNHNKTIIWSADASIGIIGLLLKTLSNKNFLTRFTCHGRDVAWDKYFYQKLLEYSLQNTDEVYAVSQKIKDIILKLWISESKITVQEHSLTNLHFPDPWIFNKKALLEKYSIPTDRVLLFSIGRFVEKKWFHWFVAEVLPFLLPKFFYVLAGDGPFGEKIKKIIQEKWLTNIILTWSVIDPIEKARLYSSMHYFIMPNIPVQWDCEGYGIVLLEAQFYWLSIIASKADGIGPDRTGENSQLLEPTNSQLWANTINKIWT